MNTLQYPSPLFVVSITSFLRSESVQTDVLGVFSSLDMGKNHVARHYIISDDWEPDAHGKDNNAILWMAYAGDNEDRFRLQFEITAWHLDGKCCLASEFGIVFPA